MKTRTFTGTTNPEVQPYELAHRAVARRAAVESIVLLKNEGNLLPVSLETPIALYGAGAGYTIKGGTGSGDVNERYSVTIAEGLKNAGYRITTQEWLDDYNRQFTGAREQWRDEIWAEQDQSPQGTLSLVDIYFGKSFAYPAGSSSIEKTETDIAVYVLSRVAGEGADRFAKEGDYYLSKAEEQLIEAICSVYPKVVLVINSGGQVDLSFTDKYENIAAILQISQLGCEGGNAFADVFSGKVSPSGRLTATWAVHYEDYPNSATFSHNNGNVNQEFYNEGIYVGYRYFDTFEVPVRYGFGFGLGYTEFKIETTDLTVVEKKDLTAKAGTVGSEAKDEPETDGAVTDEEKPKTNINMEKRSGKWPSVRLRALVTNTGSCAGRETVQVYASCPQERIAKEYRRLVGFAKTKELQPGESEELEIYFTAYDLASYCEKTPGWVLEKGMYEVFVGNSLESAALKGTIALDADEVLVKTGHICPLQAEYTAKATGTVAENGEEDAKEGVPTGLCELPGAQEKTRSRREAILAQASAHAKDSGEMLFCLAFDSADFCPETIAYGGKDDWIPEQVKAFVDGLTEDQLIQLATGDPGQGMLATVGSAGISVPGSAAQSSACAWEQGLADIVFADGPAGLRLNRSYFVKDGRMVKEPFEKGIEGGYLCRSQEKTEGEEYFQYCTAFPVGTALAQTWDKALVTEVGRAAGEEMQMFLITSWLAPGMNIQRNPLCGRNFEYYSEDPLLTGRIAAAMTDGVQSQKGCGTTIKHFACNNQEDNRKGSNSILSERTLREIYLKGFEIAVRESQPMMIMTSYNEINGVHSANNYDLCTKAARDEWGFLGFIMTDWTTTHDGPECTAAGCIRAGNDMIMPGRVEDHENIRQALRDGTLDIKDLKACICRLVNVIWKSNMYE
ncbi:MAG: glycoside hydrolase family 3 C-terminal domain-containing protein [Clostridiales bacterium]|nr:glycoside hydrolase family 3 C-terminal domain-containing protein [Clostridiales bacterium]